MKPPRALDRSQHRPSASVLAPRADHGDASRPIAQMRVLLSEDCNANCPHCFNQAFRGAGHMDTARAKRAFDLLGGHVDVVAIMGGEPTLHPDFAELYAAAQRRFKQVRLFTNGLNDALLGIAPRPADVVTFNARLIGRDFDFAKMHPGARYLRALDVVITARVSVDDLKAKIVRALNAAARAGVDGLKFLLSLDITADIFADRPALNATWRALVGFVCDLGVEHLGTDHPVPLCFWDEDSLRLNARLPFGGSQGSYPALCSLQSAGLLNARFELLHCNQYPVRLGNLFEGPDGETPIAFAELVARLQQSQRAKLLRVAERDDCRRCEHLSQGRCNGGCFVVRG